MMMMDEFTTRGRRFEEKSGAQNGKKEETS